MSDQQLLDIAADLEARVAELRLLAEMFPAGIDSAPPSVPAPAPAPSPADDDTAS